MNVPRGWTAIELLVVMGILTVLAGILLPVIARTRAQSRTLRCQANLRDLGQACHAYAGANGGWMYPTGKHPMTGKSRTAHGIQRAPHERWPALLFKLSASAGPLPYDPASYTMDPYDPATFPPEPFTPASLLCPNDPDAREAHTYILNGHLAHRGFRLGDKDIGGRTSDQVGLAGERRSGQRDYFMQEKDFDRVVDPHRHGVNHGSNYLFLDGHVETRLPLDVKAGIDPWDVVKAR